MLIKGVESGSGDGMTLNYLKTFLQKIFPALQSLSGYCGDIS